MNCRLLAAAVVLLTGCAASPALPPLSERVAALMPADALLLGEQHDAADHHRIEREVVNLLASQGKLAAVAMEMAPQGKSTAGLPNDAPEAAVQQALAWNEKAWPWPRYGPTVMAAVRAGVPVLGANLPREHMRAAMQDTSLDTRLDATNLERQRQAIREGHCDLLPEAQTAPMTRIQIARDDAMAATLVAARRPGKTVVLIAGGGHVLRDRGIPRHLPAGFNARVVLMRAGAAHEPEAGVADLIEQTPALPPSDYCASLRK